MVNSKFWLTTEYYDEYIDGFVQDSGNSNELAQNCFPGTGM